MARPLRIEGEFLWYHVYNRGNEKRDVFLSDEDNCLFLDTLFRFAATFDVQVHSFALMPNHFHLFILTCKPNLGRFMQSFQTSFARLYNDMHDRVGHVFQDRYKAIVVDAHEYSHELSRYIHLNPARSRHLEATTLRDRLKALREYPWSSYRAYCGLETSRWPIITHEILAGFGESLHDQQRKYARHVKEGLVKPSNPFEKVVAQSILGSDAFVDRIKRMVTADCRHDDTARPARRRIVGIALPKVVAVVAKEYGLEPAHIMKPRATGAAREARRVLLWAAAELCAGSLPHAEIGRRLGSITSAAVIQARNSVARALAQASPVSRHASAILDHLAPETLRCTGADDRWLEMYQRLAAYKERFRHCRVPPLHTPDLCLGAWVARQRMVRKGEACNAHPLSNEQIALLDKLGFSW